MRVRGTSSRQTVVVANGPTRPRGWRRLLGTSLASILLLGSASAFAEDGGGGEGDGDDGDDGEGDGGEIQPASEHDGMYEPCEEGLFGDFLKDNQGQLTVFFDAEGLDGEEEVTDQIDRLEIVATVDGEDCSAPIFNQIPHNVDSYLAADSDATFMDFDPPETYDDTKVDLPDRPGDTIRVIKYAFIVDADYRLEVDWRYQGIDPALNFIRPFTAYQVAPSPFDFDDIVVLEQGQDADAQDGLTAQELETSEVNPLDEEVRRANWTLAMEDPTILSAVVLDLEATWYDTDGEPTDAPDEGWEMTLSGDEGQLVTIPADEDGLAAFQIGADYEVAGDLPEGWELVDCGEDVEAVATGVGDFTADDSGTHVVCVQEVAEEPPVEEDEAEIIEIADDTEEDELPATGVAPLGLLALGGGLTFAGAGLVRRRR